MIRIIIENVVLFLLPTLIYVAYVMLRRRGQPNGTAAQVFDDAPILTLLAAGAVLAMSVLFFFVSFDEQKPGMRYIPPRYEDGKIIPGEHR